MWVLIVIVFANQGSVGGVAMTSTEIRSYDKCKAAADALIKRKNTVDAYCIQNY